MYDWISLKPAILGLLIPLILLLSCRTRGVEEISKQELFSLAIGKMDDQIDLFRVSDDPLGSKNRIIMRDGLFYVANGPAAKIMEFSSYGDLIFLLYNPKENPPPVLFGSGSPEARDVSATRTAATYPLNSIGELAVDSQKRLYVEDVVSPERQVKDRELGVILNRTVLRFDRHGNLLDYLGQEGVGGTPFPYIEGLYVAGNDEPVVVCRTPSAWLVFWFDAGGTLVHTVRIDQERLPVPESPQGLIPSVSTIVPDYGRRLLHLYLHYYQDTVDESTGLPSKIEHYAALIYPLDLATMRYGAPVEVPEQDTRRERIGSQEVEVPAPSYELLGVSEGRVFFLLRREEANLFQLLILDSQGKQLARRHLVMEDSDLYFKQVGLSAGGIIYALLAGETRAQVAWWRSDRLVREQDGEGR